MTNRPDLKIIVLAALLSTFALGIHAADVQQDAKAIEVLEQMAVYKSTLDQVVITGVTSMDARLDAGLMVSNSEEISVSISRPGSSAWSRRFNWIRATRDTVTCLPHGTMPRVTMTPRWNF